VGDWTLKETMAKSKSNNYQGSNPTSEVEEMAETVEWCLTGLMDVTRKYSVSPVLMTAQRKMHP
jgi:hypothetical protein